MDMTVKEAEPQFSQPVRQIMLMLSVVVLVSVGAYAIYPSVLPVVRANPFINGLIFAVFATGIIACWWQVYQLSSSVRWIEGFAANRAGAGIGEAPRLLAPLAALLRARGAHRQISSTSATSILDSVATRIEEARDITRYIVNLLIFLGLLGTFYGLATTVPAVVETIRSLAPQEGEGATQVFTRLMGGLEAQLGGMGTAFGSSLLGLAGSLVVGLLELFAAHGQNRFYRELEEWLSTITRLGFASGDSEASGDLGGVAHVLDHMSEQMEAMREMFTQSDVSRAMVDDKLSEVAASVTALTRTLQHDDRMIDALTRVAEGQDKIVAEQSGLAESLGKLAEQLDKPAPARETDDLLIEEGGDAEARMRLRSIDLQLLRILEELAAGRQETVADLRTDLSRLIEELRKARRG